MRCKLLNSGRLSVTAETEADIKLLHKWYDDGMPCFLNDTEYTIKKALEDDANCKFVEPIQPIESTVARRRDNE